MAANYSIGRIDLVIHDDEIPTLTITAPAIVREGEPNEIVIESSLKPVTNLYLNLTTDFPQRGVYLSAAFLRAGTNKTVLSFLEDYVAQGNRTVHMEVGYDNWTPASAQFDFIDNDATLQFVGYEGVHEGYTNSARIQLGAPAAEPIVIKLTSSRPDILTVQPTMTLGEDVGYFSYAAIENSLPPGVEPVEITATADGFPTATAVIEVRLYPPTPTLNVEVSADGASIRITFQAASGWRYFIFWNSALDTPWPIGNAAEAEVIGTIGQFTAPIGSERRFFRLIQSPL